MSRATFTWRGEEWKAAATYAVNRGLTEAAAVMADQAVRNMGTSGGGIRGSGRRIDQRGRRIGPLKLIGRPQWISSLRGGYPGVRTSNLRNSIAFVAPEALGTPLRAAFGTMVFYGRYLEFGTSRMAARPWIMRSATMATPVAMARFANRTRLEMRRLGLIRTGAVPSG
jgi:CO/xanthine dehydrogenase FAD-binding subunit